MLDWLSAYSIEHVVFSVGYLKEQIIDFVQGQEWPFAFDFAVEETPLGTGGGIRLALSLCRTNQVLVLNGDTFYPVALDRIPFDFPITLALKPLKDFGRYGSVSVAASSAIATPTREDALQITAFREKQHCDEGLINGGVYAIDRSRLDLGGLPEKFSFEKEVLEPGAAIGQIGGWVSNAYFIDIGIPEDYERAQWALPAWKAVQEASRAVLQADAQTLFLDRDGVLNRLLPGDYVRSWAQWEWMPGILTELARWSAKFRHIVLVTNQRGVGKGLMTDADLSRIHARMMTEILEAGGRMDLILACTALSEEDPRRKPNPGMFLEAKALFPDIDAKSSVLVGDSPSDAAFAANCDMRFILLNPEAVS
jgi:D-glycero-alpha-D-manno-heptose 1-phosphate guanylyltransferase